MRRKSSVLSQLVLAVALGVPATACAADVCSLETASLVQATKAAPARRQRQALAGTDSANPLTRPSLGKASDTVSIGIVCKAFYGIDMQSGTSTVDVVTSMSWTDQRVVGLIPNGTASLTFAERHAGATMWLPDLTITNRDMGKIDKLSSAVTVTTQGEVQKIDRMLVTVRNTFDERSFPWDYQDLVVLAGSATHMKSDLVFTVNHEFSGVDPDVFTGKSFSFVNSTMTVFTETAGALEKSRARFDMRLRRVSESIMPSLIVPACMLAVLGNSVFFLPFLPAFTMPRVATSTISMLAVMAHRQASTTLTPTGTALSWICVFDSAILVLVYACCLLNVLVEVINHNWENPALATKMNSELKRFMPGLSTLSILVCFCITEPGHISALWSLLRNGLFVAIGLYIVICFSRASKRY